MATWLKAKITARERWLLALFLALALARGLIYVALVPPWQASDEPYHLLTGMAINLDNAPDTPARWAQTQQEMVASLIQFNWWDYVVFVPSVRTADDIYANLPRGVDNPALPRPRAFTYYILAAALGPVKYQAIAVQLYWARLLSVITNLGVVSVAFVTGRLLFGNEPFGAWLLPAAVVLMPTNTFTMATVNDGNPAELLVSIAILLMVAVVLKGMRLWAMVGMTTFTVLAVMAKPTTFFFVPAFLAVWVWYLWTRLPGWWKAIVLPGIAGSIYLLLVAPGRLMTLVARIQQGLGGSNSEEFVADLTTLPLQRDVLSVVGRFWADLGWHTLAVSDAWAIAFVALGSVALLGLILLAWRGRRRVVGSESQQLRRVTQLFVLCVLAEVGALAVGSALWGISTVTARYMLGVLLPVLSLLVIGWREVVPARWRREGLAVMISFLLAFDSVAILWYIVPFFYPLWR